MRWHRQPNGGYLFDRTDLDLARLRRAETARWDALHERAAEEGPVASALQDILGGTELSVPLGLTEGGVVRRGKANIAATEATGATTYAVGNLATPDRIQNVVLPTDGLLAVLYHATWQESQGGSASAAVFIGANQLKVTPGSAGLAPVVQETALNALNGSGAGIANVDRPLYTAIDGLRAHPGQNNVSYSGDVTTGMLLGPGSTGSSVAYTPAGILYIVAAAGTYDVSVQFHMNAVAGGTVTVKNRRLWVWTIA